MTIENRIHQYRSNGSWYQRKTSQITKIVVHHSAIPLSRYSRDGDMMRAIQNIHQGKGWPGLSYHFVIGATGKIYQTNSLTDITWHDSVNNNSIGVLVNGYFHPDVNDQPTKEQLVSLAELLTELSTKHPEFPAGYNDIYGHRDIKSTACPGNNLYPYVTEFREKRGKVDWGVQSAGEQMPGKTYTEEEYTKVRLERDRNWDLYQDEKQHIDILQTELDQVKTIADQRKKELQDFIQELAKRLSLSTESDKGDIVGGLERLLSVEDQLNRAQKQTVQLEKKYDLEKSEIKEEIKQLRAENEQLKVQAEQLSKQNATMKKRIDILEKRLDNREQAIEASTRFTQFINNVLKLFERK